MNKGIANEEFDIPKWQIDEVRERMEDYRKNPDQALDFEETIAELEDEFDL